MKPNKLNNRSSSLAIQKISNHPDIPSQYYLRHWINIALERADQAGAVTLRIVDEAESAILNQTYRHNAGPTNVLAFPFESPPGVPVISLGDLVICAPLLSQEAQQQAKPLLAHWAHIVIHGCLHLLGYDHDLQHTAQHMEDLEINLLQSLGYTDPYQ